MCISLTENVICTFYSDFPDELRTLTDANFQGFLRSQDIRQYSTSIKSLSLLSSSVLGSKRMNNIFFYFREIIQLKAKTKNESKIRVGTGRTVFGVLARRTKPYIPLFV